MKKKVRKKTNNAVSFFFYSFPQLKYYTLNLFSFSFFNFVHEVLLLWERVTTFLGYKPYLRIIKNPRIIKDPCAHRQENQGEKGNQYMNQGSRGAKASQKYFR